ncbi:MAG TPA: RND transporter, partial [Niabella sp.]|nr:RND transporter [Niabella sp.]
MWRQLGKFILRYRFILLILLLAATALFGYWASKVTLGYEFTKAIPTNHPVNIEYKAFKKKYGEDGNMLVIGIQTDSFFNQKLFNDYAGLQKELKKVNGVEDIISIPNSVNLVKDIETEKLKVKKIFGEQQLSQAAIDSGAAEFLNLPFYKGLIYNPQTKAYLMGLTMNKEVINSAKRDNAINAIKKLTDEFSGNNHIEVKLSGLPYI